MTFEPLDSATSILHFHMLRIENYRIADKKVNNFRKVIRYKCK